MQPIAQFTVRPYAAPRCTWRVKVWSTLAGLRAGGSVRDAYGWCASNLWVPVDVHGRTSSSPKGELGVIGLAARHLSVEIVAHECTHAAFTTIAGFKECHNLRSDDHDPEEQFAYTIGDMTRDVFARLAKLGLTAPDTCPTRANRRA